MKFIPSKIKEVYAANPLQVILLVALLFRLVAAFFAKGYPFHDDHFCVIRPANSWAQGIPHWVELSSPPNHSMFYAGVNTLFMWVMSNIGIADPMTKVTVIRVIHAFYSLLVVYLSFKITDIVSSRKAAILVGWIIALLWFMPNFSVQFLAEMVCIPPVLATFYFLAKDKTGSLKTWLVVGLFFGLAFTIRIHTIFFISGLGLLMLFQKKWLPALIMSIGFLIPAFFITGLIDIYFWDYPFQSLIGYFGFHKENATAIVTGPIYRYLLTILGFAVPPISLMLFWGYYKGRKVFIELFAASLFFLLFHSFFPHKQERFILPFFPLFIISGIIGWKIISQEVMWVANREKLLRGIWTFFWTINIAAAIALALTYNRKDRVEPLYYLSEKSDISSIILESERSSPKQPPVYYLGHQCVDYRDFMNDEIGYKRFKEEKRYVDPEFFFVFSIGTNKTLEELKTEMQSVGKKANYIIFKGQKDFENRKERIEKLFPGQELMLEKEIEPSNMDKLLHFLNPRVHRNTTAFIYKVI